MPLHIQRVLSRHNHLFATKIRPPHRKRITWDDAANQVTGIIRATVSHCPLNCKTSYPTGLYATAPRSHPSSEQISTPPERLAIRKRGTQKEHPAILPALSSCGYAPASAVTDPLFWRWMCGCWCTWRYTKTGKGH